MQKKHYTSKALPFPAMISLLVMFKCCCLILSCMFYESEMYDYFLHFYVNNLAACLDWDEACFLNPTHNFFITLLPVEHRSWNIGWKHTQVPPTPTPTPPEIIWKFFDKLFLIAWGHLKVGLNQSFLKFNLTFCGNHLKLDYLEEFFERQVNWIFLFSIHSILPYSHTHTVRYSIDIMY